MLERGLGSQYEILKVSQGRRAIELAQKSGIALAVISQYLPDTGGLNLLEELHYRFPSIPVIFAAENPTKECIISAFRFGAKDFLEKPFDEQILSETVRQVLDSNRKGQNSTSLKVEWQPANSGQRFLLNLCKNRIILRSHLFRALLEFLTPVIINLSTENAPAEKSVYRRIEGDIQEDLPPQMKVYFLGTFRVVLKDQLIDHWPNRKGKAMFAYLAYHHKRRVYRDILIEKFWPCSSPDSARNCLNVALHGIRRLFHKMDPIHEYVLFKDECYFINPDIKIWLDVDEFIHYWKVGQSLERLQRPEAAAVEYESAVAKYRGDFMEDDLYETWSPLERENLKEIYLLVLDRLSKHYSLDGRFEATIDFCNAILEKDSCREDVHRRLMKCYYRMGQRDRAVKQFHKCTEILKSELEVAPTRETYDLLEQIKQDYLILEKNKNGRILIQN